MSDMKNVKEEETKQGGSEGQDQPPTRSQEANNVAVETNNRGCEGPNATFVKLHSQDGHEFIIKKDHVMKVSATIRHMFSGLGVFAENDTNEIHFQGIPSHILQKICMYIGYRMKYLNSSQAIPEFPIDPKISLELVMAANFLDC